MPAKHAARPHLEVTVHKIITIQPSVEKEKPQQVSDFSVLGGPLHRFGLLVGLVRGQTNTVLLGLALGVFLWVVAVVLATVEGTTGQIFSLSAIAAHARLLIAIPLFFVCETCVDPRFTAFVRVIVNSGIVPARSLPALESEVRRISHWRDSWLPEVLCLIAAVVMSVTAARWHLSGLSTGTKPILAAGGFNTAGMWYGLICLPVFRFLILRWLWHLALWWHFLWRTSRLNLHLVPTHPDYTAGLGVLETVHVYFVPLVLAFSIVNSASFAEEISNGSTALETIYPELAIILFIDALLFLGPLLIFGPQLWACRIKGADDYMTFAAHYVDSFDKKWLRSGAEESLLGTPDLQSLADLTGSVTVVRNMRSLPIGPRLLVSLGVAALLPLVPLLLFKFPAADLLEKTFRMLLGL
jgi:hypothetical protein